MVDDHAVVRAGVVAFLDQVPGFSVVAEAEDYAAAVAVVEAHRPAIALVDIQLPDGSGVDLCSHIGKLSPETGVVLYTSFADPELLERALENGARGYVLKRMDMTHLADTIRAAARGDVVVDPEARAAVESAHRWRDGEPPLSDLSPQELRVLELISAGYTNRQIADELDLAEKTVKNYVSSVLRKLGVSRRSEAAAIMAEREPPR